MAKSRRAFSAVAGVTLAGLAIAAPAFSGDNAKNNFTPTVTASSVVDENIQPVGLTEQSPALVRAGNYALENTSNVAIMIYYGPGNGVSEDQVGEFVADQVTAIAQDRKLHVTPDYFVEYGGEEGIAVGFLVGGDSVDKQDLKSAVQPENINEVLDKREATARMFAANTRQIEPETF